MPEAVDGLGDQGLGPARLGRVEYSLGTLAAQGMALLRQAFQGARAAVGGQVRRGLRRG